MSAPWSESLIGRGLANGSIFQRSVLIVPNCGWTGHECDLLVITKDLRIIDIEIKISRADLKADLKKDKWWHSRPWSRRHVSKVMRTWPDKCWKHYYALPQSIWDDKLLLDLPPTSGILLLEQDERCSGGLRISVKRMAKPNREAKPITAPDAIDIARLASLRMWSALCRSST